MGLHVDPHPLAQLEPAALEATRAAALACQPWIGRGSGDGADGAAAEAMRPALANASGLGTVVVGEGAKDSAPMLFVGERLGNELDELAGEESLFVATGVSGGALLRRPWPHHGRIHTDSIVIAAGSVRQGVESRVFNQATDPVSAPVIPRSGR